MHRIATGVQQSQNERNHKFIQHYSLLQLQSFHMIYSTMHIRLFLLLLIPLLATCESTVSPSPPEIGECPVPGDVSFRNALSVSPFTEFVLGNDVVFTDSEQEATSLPELQELYLLFGANEVYARISTYRNRSVGITNRSLEAGVRRAGLAALLTVRKIFPTSKA